MTFNEYVENKVHLMKSLGGLLNLNCGPNHYVLHDIIIHQPEYEYNDCLVKQIPYCYHIDLIIKCDKGDKLGEERKYEIEVPKMCEHGFLITDQESSRIKYRAPITVGEINQKLCYRGSKRKYNRLIRFGSLIYIYIDAKKGDYPSISVYENYGDVKPIIRYPLIDYLTHYGINLSDIPNELNKKSPKITVGEYALVGLPINDIDYYNNKILQLTKYDPKLTKDNPYLTAEVILKLLKLAINNPLAFEAYTPFDINFMDFSKLLFEVDLQKQKFIKNKLSDMIMKNQNIGLSITKSIYKSFSMQTESGSVQVATTSNALSFLSQSRKIYFKKYKKNDKLPIIYTTDFYGLICPSKTPESVNLTSVKNELASDVSFDENHNVLISVIPKESFLKGDLTPVEITYGKYYRSKILSIDNIDYRINKVIPKNGYVKILYLGEFKDIKYTSDEVFDYIRQSPESALTYNTGLIPFANKCDGTRIAMATNMMDQAIPVLGAKKSIVKTSLNKLIFNKSNFNIKSPVSGTVVRLVNDYITLDLGNNNYKTFSVPDTINTSMHTSNRFFPNVKVGDKINKGDVLYISDSFKDKELALTVPLRVAYYSYGQKTGEDAIVISKSASQLLSHKIIKHVRIDIPSDSTAIFDKDLLIESLKRINRLKSYEKKLEKLDKFGLPLIGTEYSSTLMDVLALYQLAKLNPDEAAGKLMMIIKQDKKKLSNQLYKVIMQRLPHEFNTGTVESVRIFYRDDKEVIDTYKDLINYYKDSYDKFIKNIKGEYNTEVPEYKIDLKKKGNIDLSIVIAVSNICEAGISDKITTRYGSKGTISDVIPDEMMPRITDEDGLPIQILIPPQSTINRKNIAQIYEMNLCLICKIAYDKNTEYIKNNNFDKVKEVLNKLYVTDKFNNYSDKNLEEFHNTFDEYYSVEVNSIDSIYNQKVMSDLCNYFEIDQDGYRLYDPVTEDLTIQKVTVGITEIMRLHFIPSLKAKATSDILDSDTAVLFGGDIRSGGQKIGEQERLQILVHGIETPINNIMENAGEVSLDEVTNIALLNELRASGIEYSLHQELGKI